jgi:acyl dehydratase
MGDDPLEELPGTRLPHGTLTLSTQDHRAFAQHVGADPEDDGTLTALWLVVSNLRGLGIRLDELFALAGCDMAVDGPMLGGCDMEMTRPVKLDQPYRTTGEVLSIERKSGRRAGVFDLMRVRVALADDHGEAAAVTVRYVLPRRAA